MPTELVRRTAQRPLMDAATRAEERRAAWYEAHATEYDRRHPGLPGDAAFYAALAGGRRVLEIGCGTGRLVRGLLGTATQVVALDRSAAMIGEARAALEDAGCGLLLLADAPLLPFRRTFELVLLTYRTVQHLSPDRRRLLWPAVGAVLREGGAVAFDPWHGPAARRRQASDVAVEPLTREELRAELGAAGFRLVRDAPFPPCAGDDSLSRVWLAGGEEASGIVENFHELLDT